MKRRELLTLLGGVVLLRPVQAQAPGRVYDKNLREYHDCLQESSRLARIIHDGSSRNR